MEVEICSDVTKARTKEMIEKNIFNRFAKLQNVIFYKNEKIYNQKTTFTLQTQIRKQSKAFK